MSEEYARRDESRDFLRSEKYTIRDDFRNFLMSEGSAEVARMVADLA